MLDQVNRIRASRGLGALTWDGQLFRAAQAHSDEQYRFGYMGHSSPDPSRKSLIQRMRISGYDGTVFGEVVAWGYTSPDAVVQGWMNSRDHRAILVDPELKQVGFSRIGEYWTGNFGTPRVQPRRRPYAAPTPYVVAQPRPTPVPPAYRPVRRQAPSTAAPRTYPTQPQPAMPRVTTVPQPRVPVQRYFQAPKPRPSTPTYRPPSRGG